MALEKALLTKSLKKALLINTVTKVEIPVQFNPEEYTLSRDINYAQAAIPGLSAPILQFVNGNMQTLEMELFLDSYEKHKVGDRLSTKHNPTCGCSSTKSPTYGDRAVDACAAGAALQLGTRSLFHLRARRAQPTLHHVPAGWYAGTGASQCHV